MTRQLLDDGHLRLLLLEIDGRPAAFDLSVCTEGYTFSYQTGFDPAVAHLRVGQVVLAEVIARAIDRGDRILDLGRGDEEYKAHWRAVPVPLESVQIADASSGGDGSIPRGSRVRPVREEQGGAGRERGASPGSGARDRAVVGRRRGGAT